MIFRMSYSTRRTVLISVIVLLCFINSQKGSVLGGIQAESHNSNGDTKESSHATLPERRRRGGGFGAQCDISSGEGEWVHDNLYPLYGSTPDCPYLSDAIDCKKNGRPDSDYQRWRWVPKGCPTIPRFNASELLENLRGKRLMFVGDSLSRHQWESMICMLHAVLPNDSISVTLKDPHSIFKAQDYNASVEFYWTTFLVDLDDTRVGNEIKKVLKIDSIENNGRFWRGIDILVFETAHWWLHKEKLKPWDYIQKGNRLYVDMDRMVAYKLGLTTWANWIDSNINPLRTRVFYRSVSPVHTNASQWNGPKGKGCYGQTEPIRNASYLKPTLPQLEVAEGVLKQMRFPVSFLNITRLSDFRKDAHPSVYAGLTPQQQRNPARFADCSHWCVWGLPDIWNELLYASLKFKPK